MSFLEPRKILEIFKKTLREVNQGSARQNDFPKVTELVTGEAGI